MQCSGFKDDAFVGSSPLSFATHAEVQTYLEDYCKRYDLASMIKFSTRVTSVRPAPDGGWTVESRGESLCGDVATPPTSDVYDAVVVCNGHYAAPSIPTIEGMEGFAGVTMHSMDYDSHLCHTDTFSNKRVLIVGARASATDIAREVARTAANVIVADRGLNGKVAQSSSYFQDRGGVGSSHGVLHHRPGVSRFSGGNAIELADGSVTEVDVVVWATGYDYNFDFLPPDLVTTKDRAVKPLYQHVFLRDDPTLAFVGLSHSVVPFPFFKIQSDWVTQVFMGASTLPSLEERSVWLEDFEASLDVPRNYHYLGDTQWDFIKWMAAQSGRLDATLESYLETNRAIYNDNKGAMPDYPGGPDTYRQRVYTAIDRSSAEFVVE
jgi:hypothetical protein